MLVMPNARPSAPIVSPNALLDEQGAAHTHPRIEVHENYPCFRIV
jgi:hypothetical protein